MAFLAGALSFLSPCVLPILPSFLAYLTGLNAEQLLNPDSVAASLS
ncbi:MAG: cytochrome c biogenesis protein CcdA [Deinococcales bacterium]